MKHKPIFHVYQNGDRFFAALPGFVNLQESMVIWLDGLESGLQDAHERLRIFSESKTRQQKRAEVKCAPGVRRVETVDQFGRREVKVKGAAQ